MEFSDTIMEILEKRGLDPRFKENPEAVRQICELISRDHVKENGQPLSYNQIEGTIHRLFDRPDMADQNGVRSAANYTINKDGTLTVNEASQIDNHYTDISRSDTTIMFSLGDKNGDLIVMQSNNYLDKSTAVADKQFAFASKGLKINTFNKNGLELQLREVTQTTSVPSANDINTVGQAFNAPNSKWSKILDECITRTPELSTEFYTRSEADSAPAFDRNQLINQFRHQDRVFGPMPYGRNPIVTDQGKIPVNPPEHYKGHLAACGPDTLEFYQKLPIEEFRADCAIVFRDAIATSSEFRATLIDEAKTNPNLKKVVEQYHVNQYNTQERNTHDEGPEL